MIRLGYHGSPHVAQSLAARSTQDVELVEYDVANPFQALRSRDLDLMIVRFGIDEPDLETGDIVGYDARAAVVSSAHPLATRITVSIEDLAAYDAFERPGSFPEAVWDLVVPRETPMGQPIRRVHRVSSVQEMLRLVATTQAVHISLVSLMKIAPSGIRVIPIEDLDPAPISLAWRRGDLPPHVEVFLKEVAG
ncbi:MAG TPA: LysR substrate-binding domain-containing protein [Candidatus Limnocylindrales bacterium]|nr:LysR substrate-binding domain-containing protein [Candidatus Limnocylindrales bacterium]